MEDKMRGDALRHQVAGNWVALLAVFSFLVAAPSLMAEGYRLAVTASEAGVYLKRRRLGTFPEGHEFRSMEKRGKWFSATVVTDGKLKVGWVREKDVKVLESPGESLLAPPLPNGLVRKKGTVYSKRDGAVLIRVPAGSFIPGNRRALELGRAAKEYVDEFFIDAFEVTNAQYLKFVSEARHDPPPYLDDERFNDPRQPVIGVTYRDASAYAKWAGRRLPTSQEWEKAARGPNGNLYPWGSEKPSRVHTAVGQHPKKGASLPIGSRPLDASIYGVLDLAGNVREWTSTASEKGRHVGRGFSWAHPVKEVRLGHSVSIPDEFADDKTGFRCALSAD